MYSAIKSEQILQPLDIGRSSTSSLKAGAGMMRNRSFRSNQNLKRGSIRGLSFLAAQATISPYSSNNNLDGRTSPAPSFATSEVCPCPSLEPLRPSLSFFFDQHRPYTGPRQHSLLPPSVLPTTSRILSYARHRRTIIIVSKVTLRIQQRPAYQMKSWPYLEHLGPRKECSAGNTSLVQEGNAPRINHGWMFSSSSRRANSACLSLATTLWRTPEQLGVGTGL